MKKFTKRVVFQIFWNDFYRFFILYLATRTSDFKSVTPFNYGINIECNCFRKLLKDILSIKKRCLILEGKQKDNLEEQISQYLRKEILPLWPDGWMYLNSLKKVYNNMTENAKMLENNNSKSNTPKQHSGITITPVSNNKPPAKTDVTPNSVTFSKINANEVKASPNVTEISPTTSHLGSFNINNIIPLKTPQPQKPSVPPAATIKEVEKSKEHEFKKATALPETYKFSRNQEPSKAHPDIGMGKFDFTRYILKFSLNL